MAAFTTMAIVSAIGLGVEAYSKWKAGSAEKKIGEAQQRAADSEAELSDYNASIAELQASDALARGREEENRFRERVEGTIGSARAGAAAQGIDVGFGSAVDVQKDARFLGELDALTIRTNAGREAWGYKVEAEDLRRRSTIQRKEGVEAAAAGRSRQTAARVSSVGGAVLGGANLLETRYGIGRKKK